MDCRGIEFSPEKSQERITRALKVFPPKVLNKILAFSIYLLGAKRRSVAELVGLPDESVKTAVRVVLRDGLAALRDRRCSRVDRVPEACRSERRLSARREEECWVVDFGVPEKERRIPLTHRIEARTVLLSLLKADLLSTPEVATALGLSGAHCRELAGKLSSDDVVDALVDKRQGQKQDYRVGPEKKAEIIQQFAARVVTGQSTSSDVLAQVVNADSEMTLSPRTVRWHMEKLGLDRIKKTLPELVRTLKKNFVTLLLEAHIERSMAGAKGQPWKPPRRRSSTNTDECATEVPRESPSAVMGERVDSRQGMVALAEGGGG